MQAVLPSTPPDNALCLGCGYALRALPENRCPECGRGFNPADPTSFDVGIRLPRWLRWLLRPAGWTLRVGAVAAGVMLALAPHYRFLGGTNMTPLIGFIPVPNAKQQWDSMTALTWLALLVVWTLRTASRTIIVRLFRKPASLLQNDRPVRRFSSCIFLIAFGLSFCLLYECPHATYWSIWTIGGIAHSSGHGPCYHQASWSAHLIGKWYLFIR
jgi:hypothetical protein